MPRRHFAAPTLAFGILFFLATPAASIASAEVPSAALAQYKNRLKSLLSAKREQDVGLFIREMADLDHPDTVELIFPARCHAD